MVRDYLTVFSQDRVVDVLHKFSWQLPLQYVIKY